MSLSKTFFIALAISLLPLKVIAADSVEVHEAWIPQAPPVAMMHAGYLRVKNNTTAPVVIVAAQSADYGAVEIHKTVTEGGMARMIEQNEITVPAGQAVNFQRGGLHLMLMQPKRKLKLDDKVEVKLMTKDNKVITFTATVKAATLGEHDHSHHHHH